MSGTPLLKKPKIEIRDEGDDDEITEEQSRDEREDALVALFEHRTKEVEHLRQRITYYNSQVVLFTMHIKRAWVFLLLFV